MNLTNAQKKHLRQIAHHLKVTVWIGKNGLSSNLLSELESSLEQHELLKIKSRFGDREERKKSIKTICEKTGAEFVQCIGNIITIYKKNEEKPQIKLP